MTKYKTAFKFLANRFTSFTDNKIISTLIVSNNVFMSGTVAKHARIMPGLHLQRNRRKSAIQKIYDGRGNFKDCCVASGARLLRRLRCSTLTTVPS